MARLFINDRWYEPQGSFSHYESEYERVIAEHGPRLFPEYVMVPFKVMVSSPNGQRKPDFALVELAYRSWWVVEIELAHHPMIHVMDQVSVFATATYGEPEADVLSRGATSLDRSRLSQMMKGAPPGVLVVVDSPKPEWLPGLHRWGARLAVVEIYRSDHNHHVLRVNGAYPSVADDVLSTCACDPGFQRLVLLDSPAAVPVPDDGKLLIQYQDSFAEWELIESRDRVWLSPVRSNPLPPGTKFALIRSDQGHLTLKPI